MKQPSYSNNKANTLTRISLVAALYVVVTLVTAPLSFGMGVRFAEGLNFLGLYNKRHIYAVTLGVFIVNYFAYGFIDMVVGSLSTLVFLMLGVYLADWLVDRVLKHTWWKIDPMIIKYIIVGIIFTLSMFTIAIMVVFLDAEAAFWPLYIEMMIAEALSLVCGGIIVYLISKRIDFTT